MTYKAKLITSICAFFLVLALLAAGVWAAKTVNISIGGTVNFTATSVYCNVDGVIKGSKEGTQTLTQLHFEADESESSTLTGSWTPDLNFVDEGDTMGQDITMTITITNLATRGLNVRLTDTSSQTPGYGDQNVGIDIKYGTTAENATTYNSGTTQTITAGTTSSHTTGVFVITFHLATKNNPATLNYNFTVNLENAG